MKRKISKEKPVILMMIKDNLYKLIFSHIEDELNKEFELIKIDSNQLNDEELSSKLLDFEKVKGYISSWGSPKVNVKFLELFPNLEIVAHAAGSVKGIVCNAVYTKGIAVTSAHMALAPSVGETTMMLTLMGLKLYNRQENRMKKGMNRTKEPVGYELLNKKVGLVGYGRIARCFRKLLKSFDVEVLVYDPFLKKEQLINEDISLVSFENLLSNSDIISLHAPGTDENDSMLNAQTLAKMKDDTLIVNTARGNLIDEDALYEELKTGRLRAALDVFRKEPLPLDSPLRELDNIVLTPHIGGYTFDSRKQAGELIFAELKRYFNGKALKHQSNFTELDHRA